MTYKVELVPSDRGYFAACPELPGCISEGSDEADALLNIREAIRTHLSAQKPAETTIIRFVDIPVKQSSSREPFVVEPLMSHPFPVEWTSEKVEDLLDILEGPDRKW